MRKTITTIIALIISLITVCLVIVVIHYVIAPKYNEFPSLNYSQFLQDLGSGKIAKATIKNIETPITITACYNDKKTTCVNVQIPKDKQPKFISQLIHWNVNITGGQFIHNHTVLQLLYAWWPMMLLYVGFITLCLLVLAKVYLILKK